MKGLSLRVCTNVYHITKLSKAALVTDQPPFLATFLPLGWATKDVVRKGGNSSKVEIITSSKFKFADSNFTADRGSEGIEGNDQFVFMPFKFMKLKCLAIVSCSIYVMQEANTNVTTILQPDRRSEGNEGITVTLCSSFMLFKFQSQLFGNTESKYECC